MITLHEEEEHVCSYLQIQQARYRDIMRYTVNIAPELKDVSLLLRPDGLPLLQVAAANSLHPGAQSGNGPGDGLGTTAGIRACYTMSPPLLNSTRTSSPALT